MNDSDNNHLEQDKPSVAQQTEGVEEKPRSRGIYLLPNLFTTAGLFAGFYSIVAAINDRFEAAAVTIFIAMVLDGIDGRVARMTHTQTNFGAEYDSLVDMVAFGLAPALVVYLWCLQSLGKVGWLIAFIYAACAALRLARFNTQNGSAEKRFFKGLASPSAAAIVAGFVWVSTDYMTEPTKSISVIGLVLTLFAGLLMVSNILFRSFKDFDVKSRVPFVALLVVVLVFVLISIDPPIVLFAGFLIYALSGPIGALFRRVNKSDNDSEPNPSA